MTKLLTFLIDFVGSKLNILILSPNFRSFGNSMDEIYFGILHCMERNKRLLIVYPLTNFFGKKISFSNPYLYQIQHSKIIILPKPITFLISTLVTLFLLIPYIYINLRKVLAKFLKLEEAFYNDIHLSHIATLHLGKKYLWRAKEKKEFSISDWYKLEKRFIPPSLPDDLVKKSKDTMISLFPNIANRKWVALHVLDNTKEDNLRGADIKNYYPSIRFLIAQGYNVLRLGHNMPKCENIEGLFDLVDKKYEKYLDLYIFMKADFHIVVNSGPSYAANLFKKDVLMTNTTEWSTSVPRKKNNFFIPKKFFFRMNNQVISLFELLDKNYSFQVHSNKNSNSLIYMKENTEEEILLALKDFLSVQENSCSSLQLEFNEKRKIWLEVFKSKDDIKILDSHQSKIQLERQKKRIIAMSSVSGTVAESFLQNNWKNIV